ncbi:MAG: Ig-like domain-containing protein, partial [Phycisphaerae bacterium]|nr:Ig-like domain-containing protein [Phycisphaerae bacterium]
MTVDVGSSRRGVLATFIVVALAMIVQAAPRVLDSVPADGAEGVDPACRKIVITFDVDMDTGSFTVLQADGGEFPDLAGEMPFVFRDARTFVMHVALAPDTAYALRLNSETRKGFASADGVPLAPTIIRFRTQGAEARPKRKTWGSVEPADPSDRPQPKTDRKWGAVEPPDDRTKPPTRDKAEPEASADKLPQGWILLDDKLYGTRVAVPPGWTPRVRGEVAFCVEPDTIPQAGVFFVPVLVRDNATPASLAEEFDGILRRGVPSWQTRSAEALSDDSVQRDLVAEIGGTRVVGRYRAVVGRARTGFVMGYLAPPETIERLQPLFHRILSSYRYSGPGMRLQPFKSAAVELKVPPGWQVRTSEGDGTADADIDWEVFTPQIPGARAFMFTPKFFSPNWVSDLATGQADPTGLAIWQGKGCQMANIASDQQALQLALAQALPGLRVEKEKSLDEIRNLLDQVFAYAAQTLVATGGRLTWYAYEIQGRRVVNGVEMRSVITFGMSAMTTPGGIKGTLGLWNAQVKGFEAPADAFPRLAPLLDRVTDSFTYTLWWIRTVQKANAQQGEAIRKFWAESNRIDKEIFDNRMQTQGAISEMMYDHLTDNYAYVNKETNSIEKIPAEQAERFRRQDGEMVSPEDV